jgi:hypothetical protein
VVELDNSRDRALRFHKIAVRHMPSGSADLLTIADAEEFSGPPLTRYDVGDSVGRQHRVTHYVQPDWIRCLVRETVLQASSDESLDAASIAPIE